MAAAGAAACILAPVANADPARRLAVAGATLEGVSSQVMERYLGTLARPYHEDAAGRFSLAAKSLTVAGAAVVTRFGRRRLAAATGGLLLLGGSVCERFAVYLSRRLSIGTRSASHGRAPTSPDHGRCGRLAGERSAHRRVSANALARIAVPAVTQAT